MKNVTDKDGGNGFNRRRMRLADLKPHPLQSLIYTPCSEAEDLAFADNLRRHGQREPIVVMPPDNKVGLPDVTVLDGNRRKKGLLSNGETEADVIIRDDLENADEATVTEAFLSYNQDRRQLHPLDRARISQHLFMSKQSIPLARLDVWKRGELRERIGKVLDMSGRNLDRYLRVLECPLEIQTAVRDGKLGLVLGSRVANLPAEQQQELAARVAALLPKEKVNDMVTQYLNLSGSGNQRRVSDIVRNFAVKCKEASSDLSGRMDEVETNQARGCLSHFDMGMKLLEALKRKAS